MHLVMVTFRSPSQATSFSRQIKCQTLGLQKVRMYEELTHGPGYVDWIELPSSPVIYITLLPHYRDVTPGGVSSQFSRQLDPWN